MDFETVNIWYWIIPIVIGILSGILGYLIGRSKTKESSQASGGYNPLEIENAKLRADLEVCQKTLSIASNAAATRTIPTPPTKASPSRSTPYFDGATAKVAMGRRIREDDLKIVEGIGPKIESLFHNFGITTWKDLSEVSTVKCQEVLNSGGKRYRIHDPASWPMQAKMAYEGKWKILAKWQDKHRAGKF